MVVVSAQDSCCTIGSCETPAPNTKGVKGIDSCATDDFSKKTRYCQILSV